MEELSSVANELHDEALADAVADANTIGKLSPSTIVCACDQSGSIVFAGPKEAERASSDIASATIQTTTIASRLHLGRVARVSAIYTSDYTERTNANETANDRESNAAKFSVDQIAENSTQSSRNRIHSARRPDDVLLTQCFCSETSPKSRSTSSIERLNNFAESNVRQHAFERQISGINVGLARDACEIERVTIAMQNALAQTHREQQNMQRH